MNHCELQALRKLLMIDVSEAAEYIGKVSARTWQYWESSRYNIPEDVIFAMSQLSLKRKTLLEQLKNKYQTKLSKGEPFIISYYQHYSAYRNKFSKGDVIAWRLHQSTAAEMLAYDQVSLESMDSRQEHE